MRRVIIKKAYKRAIVLTVVLGTLLPACFVVIKNIAEQYQQQVHTLFTPQTVSFEIHHIYQKELEDQIRSYVTAQTNQSMLDFDPKVFYIRLKSIFPIIKNLTWNFSSTQNLHLVIQGVEPYCIINDHYVLGDKKRLFDKTLFNPQHLSTLNKITINEHWIGEKLNKKIFKFIHKITPEHWNNYHITYTNRSSISLVPHVALCRCRIITTEKTFFAKHKFESLGRVFADLCKKQLITQKILESKKKILLGFDFRIKNQIIVTFYEPSKRGRGS